MKQFFLLLLSLPMLAGAQDLVLLDRNLKEPITACDRPSTATAYETSFPMYTADIAEVIERLELYARHLASGKTLPWSSDTLEGKHSLLLLNVEAKQFTCVLQTRDEHFHGSLILAYEQNRRQTIWSINKFVEYLRNNRSGVLATTREPKP